MSAPTSRGCCASSARRATAGCPRSATCSPATSTEASARIDAAADDAGRDPRAIRRLLNIGQLPGTAAEQVEFLTTLALDAGTSLFIIPGDDPDAMAAFAAEVAPAVREAVAAARA